MRRSRVTSRPTWPNVLPAMRMPLISAANAVEIATLFTDITSFTALVETLEPSVLGPLLNEYLTGMTDIVFAHDGTVAKIVGDALHVLFGAPGEQPDHADRAVNCALALDEYVQSFRERWHKKGIALGVTRIGVHAGPAIVGNFGGGHFFDYTAYGDTINVACAARNSQQTARYPHLRQCNAGRGGKEIPGPAGGGPVAQRQGGGPACLRTPYGRTI